MRFCLLLLLFVPLSAPAYEREFTGSLVIVGGGKLPDAVRDRFFELAGGKDKARIVVIPTATAEADAKDAEEKFTKPWADLKPEWVRVLHTRDRKAADSAEFVKPLTEATAVWFPGGDQKRITEVYLGTAVEKELAALLQRGGVIGGTSAGAAIMSEVMIENGNQKAAVGKGFGWLKGFVVDQHFLARNRLDRLMGVVHDHPGFVGLGVDEATAVVVQKRSLKVIGDSCALVLMGASKTKPASVQVVKSGAEADLFQLRRAAQFRKDGTFPPEKPEVPNVPKGTLMIGGGGPSPSVVMKKFVELAGGPDARIVFVATAGDDPIPAEPGEVKIFKLSGAKNVKVLHTRDPEEANKPEFCKDLKEATGVWFSGGRQWRFVDAYEGTECEKLFLAVLERGGVIGGSSSGASIQSEYMPRGHPLGNTVMMAEGYERGFGYLKGVAVDQHFFARKRTADMTEVVGTYPQLLGVGIDEGTFIVVKGSVFEVVGRGNVAVYDAKRGVVEGKDYLELKPGTKYDMAGRKVVGEK
jgi:cyanophycinase